MSCVFVGSEYGGWFVADQLLSSNALVYSFGLGTDITFDLEMIRLFKSVVYGFDPTPRSLSWLGNQSIPPEFHIQSYGLADFDGDLDLYQPVVEQHVSLSSIKTCRHGESLRLPVKKLSTIMSELGHRRLDVLKMDIEGAEYDVIDDLVSSPIRPTQLLVEFHHSVLGVGFPKTKSSVQSLLACGYEILRISDSGNEFSFVFGQTDLAKT
ncbi:MAG: FkbM family methyltransferase [bacterium]|nr:FkbM family methyltransferase [bacterium]